MFKKLLKKIRRLRDASGNVAIMFAVAGPAALMGLGLAVDFAQVSSKSSNLQKVADAAALASAHELPLANSDAKVIEAVAENYIKTNLSGTPSKIESSVTVSKDFTTVNVTIKEIWKPTFAHFFSDKVTPIVSQATARMFGSKSVCVVGLMPSKLAGIHLDNNAKLTADDCGVYSNSTSFGSIRLDGKSELTAHMVCSMGGTLKLFGATVDPKPLSDCPKLDDPLEKRPAPSVSGCDFIDHKIGDIAPLAAIESTSLKSLFSSLKTAEPEEVQAITPPTVGETGYQKTTLRPGVYCGGLEIGQDQDVTLEAGVYIIKDGPLRLTGNGRMAGEGVGFFLTGDTSLFEFQAETRVSLSAPVSGPLAGLLFYEDRNVTYSFSFNPFNLNSLNNNTDVRVHRIQSNDARKLLGTIYLPRSIFIVDANAPVADESAFTAIVTGRLWLREGPNLVLNSDYAATDVPLPSSMVGGEIALTN